MGIIKDNKKFERTEKQTHPTNPDGIARKTNVKEFDIDKKTIKDHQNK